jgi:SAM-dependent methyltransferase
MRAASRTAFDVIRRIVPKRLKDVLKYAANPWLAKINGYKCQCPFCNLYLHDFTALLIANPTLRKDLEYYGFDPARLNEFETLNVDHYMCPHCGSTDRDRLYLLFLERQLRNGQQSVRMVDFAPTAPLRRWLTAKPSIQYRSADLFMQDVDDKLDVQNLCAYGNNTFDCFICSHVLEHVADDHQALRELHRILRSGGWGIIMAPIRLTLKATEEDSTCHDPGERVRRFAQADHLRLYSKQDFIERLKGVGFSVSQLTGRELAGNSCAKLGIAPESVLYVVHKQQ